MQPDFMSVKEVAKYFNISAISIYRHIKLADGFLPEPIRIGTTIRFKREEIEKMFNKTTPIEAAAPKEETTLNTTDMWESSALILHGYKPISVLEPTGYKDRFTFCFEDNEATRRILALFHDGSLSVLAKSFVQAFIEVKQIMRSH